MSLFAQTCSFIRMNLISCWASKKTWSYKCTIHYIDDVFTLNNSKFDDYADLIYPIELEIKYTTDITRSTSYLDLGYTSTMILRAG